MLYWISHVTMTDLKRLTVSYRARIGSKFLDSYFIDAVAVDEWRVVPVGYIVLVKRDSFNEVSCRRWSFLCRIRDGTGGIERALVNDCVECPFSSANFQLTISTLYIYVESYRQQDEVSITGLCPIVAAAVLSATAPPANRCASLFTRNAHYNPINKR